MRRDGRGRKDQEGTKEMVRVKESTAISRIDIGVMKKDIVTDVATVLPMRKIDMDVDVDTILLMTERTIEKGAINII
jgi:hypothetical protein